VGPGQSRHGRRVSRFAYTHGSSKNSSHLPFTRGGIAGSGSVWGAIPRTHSGAVHGRLVALMADVYCGRRTHCIYSFLCFCHERCCLSCFFGCEYLGRSPKLPAGVSAPALLTRHRVIDGATTEHWPVHLAARAHRERAVTLPAVSALLGEQAGGERTPWVHPALRTASAPLATNGRCGCFPPPRCRLSGVHYARTRGCGQVAGGATNKTVSGVAFHPASFGRLHNCSTY